MSAAIAATGKVDPADSQYGVLKDHGFAPVTTDRIVTPGAVVRTGPLRLTMSATPGHTTGSTSWTWQSCAGARCRTISYVDSISALAVPPYRFIDHPDVVARFRRTFSAIAARRCGILVTPHPSVSNLFERMLGKAPLGPEGACKRYADMGRKGLDAELAKEAAETPK